MRPSYDASLETVFGYLILDLTFSYLANYVAVSVVWANSKNYSKASETEMNKRME